MWERLSKWNTLRNQIFVIFVFVMAIVLFFAGGLAYNTVSTLLKTNAERQIQQTAVQASSRMEALYEHVDLMTTQVATNSFVQQLLLEDLEGESASFDQRQAIMQIVNSYVAYSNGIDSFEIYLPNYARLFPLNEADLPQRVNVKSIEQARQENGRFVWVGRDPSNPDFFLGLKQINLVDRWFSPGGYLIVRVRDTYLEFDEPSEEDEYMILVDEQANTMTSNYEGDVEELLNGEEQTVTIENTDYMLVKHTSDITGWQTVILTPINTVTEDVSVLRTTLLFSAAAGFGVFFLFSFLLSTVITRPILKLTKAMRYGKLGALKPSKEISPTVEINELIETYNQMVETMNHLMQAVYEKEIIRSRSELKALQAQINPHFLFNTLEALYWSLDEKGEDELADNVLAMSDLFRYTISSPQQADWVNIKDEFDHIERYMQLMKMRFEDRLAWKVSLTPGYETVKIPKLLIQPIVENAILHGIGNKDGEGFVEIEAIPTDDLSKLVMTIKDNGPGITQSKINDILNALESERVPSEEGNGMAIPNVNKRLRLYYNDANIRELSITSEVGKGTVVTLEIPMNGGFV
ncbi:sensor histidine kinase [Alteribacter populi]|uniref:sensor histidine kinase n=1 Tax=Alteribacter populi TaxID=2011011 RepID=UPI0018E1F545|nr:sensor histidine kinase [Alteribacter populi]